jgi:preprotein translocase subunit SecF
MSFLKPIEFIPRGTKLPFMSYFKYFGTLSLLLSLATVGLLFTKGLNFGIDFRGGTLIELKTKDGREADLPALRAKIGELGLGEVQIQQFGQPDDVLVRVAEQPGGEAAQQQVVKKIQAALGESMEYRRQETVGGAVSRELVQWGVIALICGNFGIALYVGFRFEWQFSVGAILSLLHDTLLTLGIFSALQLDFSQIIIVAILTIIGYSINDTVVIYDRIRENLRKYKRMPLSDLIDLSVNETLSRTVMTVATVLITLLALFFLGGEVIHGFTFAMLWGVLIGTYSSVFIAAPVLILVGVTRDEAGARVGEGRPAPQGKPAKAEEKPAKPEDKPAPTQSRGARAAKALAARTATDKPMPAGRK